MGSKPDLSGDSPLDALRKAVIDQKKAILPADEEDPALVGLHQAVENYDRVVSEIVFGVIQHLPIEVSPEAALAARAKITREMQQPEVESHTRMAFYHRYLARLDRMLELAWQVKNTQT